MRAYQPMKCWHYGMLGFDILPYQLSLGVTLRAFEGGLYFRLYAGPLKLLGGVYRPFACGVCGGNPCDCHYDEDRLCQ